MSRARSVRSTGGGRSPAWFFSRRLFRAANLAATPAALLLSPAGVGAQAAARVPVVGLPCEGCEAVFVGLPEAPTSTSRIAPEDEPGESMRIEGTVYDAAGRPAAGVIVYAYHTDATGAYPSDERLRGDAARHGRLRGWAISDVRGRYRFDTIRPASYPDAVTPAHVHMHIIEVACCTYYIDSIQFDDDPRLTPEERERDSEGRGGPAVVQPERRGDVWRVRRDIILGEGVPGYRLARDPDPGV